MTRIREEEDCRSPDVGSGGGGGGGGRGKCLTPLYKGKVYIVQRNCCGNIPEGIMSRREMSGSGVNLGVLRAVVTATVTTQLNLSLPQYTNRSADIPPGEKPPETITSPETGNCIGVKI